MEKNYIAGFLENVGCFNIRTFKNRKGRKEYPIFKILIKPTHRDKVKVMKSINNHLKKNMTFHFKDYEAEDTVIYQIQNDAMVLEIIKFLESNCLIKKPKQDKVKNVIERYAKEKK